MTTRSMFRLGSHTSTVKGSKLSKREEVPVARDRPAAPTADVSIINVVRALLPELTPEQQQKIANIKGLSTDNYPLLVEVIGCIKHGGENAIDEIYDILKNRKSGSTLSQNDDIVWEFPTMTDYEKHYRNNIDMEFAKRGGTVLRDVICPKCRGNEYSVTEAQLATADEPIHEIRVCVTCHV